jgi:D-alanyl-D-alanine carboxypeptidase
VIEVDANSERLLAEVNPELQRRFRQAVAGVAARGVGVVIESGLRSRAQQIALYNNRANNSNPVAAPGTSPHEFGWAVDAVPVPRTQAARNVLWDEARKAGLVAGEDFSTRKDPPHFELPGFQHGSASQNLSSVFDSQGALAFAGGDLFGGVPMWLIALLVGVVVVKRFL